MKTFPIAVQPNTIREALSQDYEGALERVAAIGYRGIELGRPPQGITIARQKELLDRLGRFRERVSELGVQCVS